MGEILFKTINIQFGTKFNLQNDKVLTQTLNRLFLKTYYMFIPTKSQHLLWSGLKSEKLGKILRFVKQGAIVTTNVFDILPFGLMVRKSASKNVNFIFKELLSTVLPLKPSTEGKCRVSFPWIWIKELLYPSLPNGLQFLIYVENLGLSL